MRSLSAILLLFAVVPAHAQTPTVQQVSARMAATRGQASSQIRGYTVLRRYTLSTGRGHSAEMMVRLTYTWPGQKKFEILSESGSNTIQKKVFNRLLDAEEDAARRDARLTPANYQFRSAGIETVDGRSCYVLELTPRVSGKYLIRGRAWVDSTDFAVVRVEGEPVDTGSFWIKSTHMVQKYRKVGAFWMPASIESDAEVRIFGRAHLSMESRDYKLDYFETEDRAELLSRRPGLE
jgi:hypothetical protein